MRNLHIDLTQLTFHVVASSHNILPVVICRTIAVCGLGQPGQQTRQGNPWIRVPHFFINEQYTYRTYRAQVSRYMYSMVA